MAMVVETNTMSTSTSTSTSLTKMEKGTTATVANDINTTATTKTTVTRYDTRCVTPSPSSSSADAPQSFDLDHPQHHHPDLNEEDNIDNEKQSAEYAEYCQNDEESDADDDHIPHMLNPYSDESGEEDNDNGSDDNTHHHLIHHSADQISTLFHQHQYNPHKVSPRTSTQYSYHNEKAHSPQQQQQQQQYWQLPLSNHAYDIVDSSPVSSISNFSLDHINNIAGGAGAIAKPSDDFPPSPNLIRQKHTPRMILKPRAEKKTISGAGAAGGGGLMRAPSPDHDGTRSQGSCSSNSSRKSFGMIHNSNKRGVGAHHISSQKDRGNGIYGHGQSYGYGNGNGNGQGISEHPSRKRGLLGHRRSLSLNYIPSSSTSSQSSFQSVSLQQHQYHQYQQQNFPPGHRRSMKGSDEMRRLSTLKEEYQQHSSHLLSSGSSSSSSSTKQKQQHHQPIISKPPAYKKKSHRRTVSFPDQVFHRPKIINGERNNCNSNTNYIPYNTIAFTSHSSDDPALFSLLETTQSRSNGRVCIPFDVDPNICLPSIQMPGVNNGGVGDRVGESFDQHQKIYAGNTNMHPNVNIATRTEQLPLQPKKMYNRQQYHHHNYNFNQHHNNHHNHHGSRKHRRKKSESGSYSSIEQKLSCLEEEENVLSDDGNGNNNSNGNNNGDVTPSSPSPISPPRRQRGKKKEKMDSKKDARTAKKSKQKSRMKTKASNAPGDPVEQLSPRGGDVVCNHSIGSGSGTGSGSRGLSMFRIMKHRQKKIQMSEHSTSNINKSTSEQQKQKQTSAREGNNVEELVQDGKISAFTRSTLTSTSTSRSYVSASNNFFKRKNDRNKKTNNKDKPQNEMKTEYKLGQGPRQLSLSLPKKSSDGDANVNANVDSFLCGVGSCSQLDDGRISRKKNENEQCVIQ